MPIYGATNTFAAESGNVPVSQLDQNFTDVLLGVNNAFLSGTHAARPAPDGIGKGRYYFETDTATLFRDNGIAWVQVAAGVTAAGSLTQGVPLTMNPFAVATVQTQNHTLGVLPLLFFVQLININPDGGWNAGQHMMVPVSLDQGGAGWSITADSVAVTLSTGSAPAFITITGSGSFTITPADWQLQIVPFRVN